MSEVFIAHERSDRDRAQQLAAALQFHLYRAWWDFDFLPQRIEGQSLRSVVDRTGATLLIWSPRGAVSDVVVDVASHAAAQAKLVAVRFEDVRVPPAFAAWPSIDLSDWDGSPDSAELGVLMSQIEARALSFLPEVEGLRRARDKRLNQDVSAFSAALQRKKGEAVWKSYLDRWPDGIFAAVAAAEMRSSVGAYVSPVELAHDPAASDQWQTPTRSWPAIFNRLEPGKLAPRALVLGGVLALAAGVGFGVQFVDLKPQSERAARIEASRAPVAATAPEARSVAPAGDDPAAIEATLRQNTLLQGSTVQDPPVDHNRVELRSVQPTIERERATPDARARAALPGPAPTDLAQAQLETAPVARTAAQRGAEPPLAQVTEPQPAQQRTSQTLPPADGAPFDLDALDRATRDAVQNARRAERRALAAATAFRNDAQTASISAQSFVYAGDVSRGAPQGQGEAVWQNGARYRGAWREGKPHGWGVLTYADGGRYEGEFAYGRPTGNGVLWASTGQRVIGSDLYATLLRRPG